MAQEDLSPVPVGGGARRGLEVVGSTILFSGGLTALLGFAGAWWWPFDLLSHFRLQYAAASVLAVGLLAFARCWRRVVLGLVVFGINGVCLWPYLPWGAAGAGAEGGHPRVRILYANVLTTNASRPDLLEMVAEVRPDVILLAELGAGWQQTMEALSAGWPHKLEAAREDNFGWGLYSRWPLEDGVVTPGRSRPLYSPLLRATVRVEGVAVRLFGIHPLPPVGGEAAAHRNRDLRLIGEEVAEAAAEPDGRVLAVGDFNATPWSVGFRTFVAASGLQDSALGRGIGPGGLWPTWSASKMGGWKQWLPVWIPIDHAFAGPGVRVLERRIGPRMGSDHSPLILDIDLPPLR